MKKVVMICIIIFIQCVGIIHNAYSGDQKNYTYVLYDNVRVRKSPEENNTNIIGKLNSGVKVQIVSKSDKFAVYNGLNGNWIEVSYNLHSRNIRGYIWSGLLSLDDITVNGKNFIFGIGQYKPGKGYGCIVKMVDADKVVSSQMFYLTCGDSSAPTASINGNIEFHAYGNLGFDKIDNLIRVAIVPISDGIRFTAAVIAMNKDQFVYLADETYRSEGGVGSYADIYRFPQEEFGEANKIVRVYTEYIFNSKEMKDKLKTQWKKYYTLEKSGLVQIP